MKQEILIAGSGGQGVVLAGSILAHAAAESDLETCGMVSYGVEMRGGTANASVIISDKKIGSPVVVHPTIAIILNNQSLDKFEKEVEKILKNKASSRADWKMGLGLLIGFGLLALLTFMVLNRTIIQNFPGPLFFALLYDKQCPLHAFVALASLTVPRATPLSLR